MKLRKNTLYPLRMERLDALPRESLPSVGSLPLELLLASPPMSSLLRRPSELLLAYQKDRRSSLLARIFKLANHAHQHVDRVVLFAPSEIKLAIESVWKTCCQPFWNELTRGDRGSKPRITFVGHDFDNDAIQGSLHMLGAHRDIQCRDVLDRWSLVIIEPQAGGLRSELALKYFLPALQRQLSNRPELIAESVVAITAPNGPWADQYRRLGLIQCLEIPGLDESFDTLSTAATLFPAALLGINVVELLAGAAAGARSAERASELPCSPIQMALWNGERVHGWDPIPRILHLWSSSLEPLGGWYQSMVDRYLRNTIATFQMGGSEIGVELLEANPLALAELSQRDIVRHHITTDAWRFDELQTAEGKTLANSWSDLQKAFVDGASRQGVVQTQIHLPIIDELHVGQLMQWLQLGTATEQWLQHHSRCL